LKRVYHSSLFCCTDIKHPPNLQYFCCCCCYSYY